MPHSAEEKKRVVARLRRIQGQAAAEGGVTAPTPKAKPAKGQSGFMAKFEQRWQDRNRRDGRDS